MRLPDIIFIVGPTGVGKTSVGCALAQKINGEVVSCDAMQVYKEVSIASNKPPRAVTKKVRHHCIGIVSVNKKYDVAAYRARALAAIQRIRRKKKIPVVVGGSGLYVSVLLDGIFSAHKKDEALRARLQAEAAEKGTAPVYARLCRVDPEAAARIHPNDAKRIIRALEVFALNGVPMSQIQKNRSGLWGSCPIEIVALNRERAALYDIINRRVEAMARAGLVNEVKTVLKKRLSLTARSIIGIQEIRGYLAGDYDYDRALYLIKMHTRQYAKRQLTWFRRDTRLRWITIKDSDTPSTVAQGIAQEINRIYG